MFSKRYLCPILVTLIVFSEGVHAQNLICSEALTSQPSAEDQAVQRLEQMLSAPYAGVNDGLFAGTRSISINKTEAQNMYQLALTTWQRATNSSELRDELKETTKFKNVQKLVQLLRHLFRTLGESHTAPERLEQLAKKLGKMDGVSLNLNADRAEDLAAELSSAALTKALNSFKASSQSATSTYMQSLVQNLQTSLVIRRPMSAGKIQKLRVQMREILTPLRLRQALTPDPSLAMLIRRLSKLRELMGQQIESTVPLSVRDAVTTEGPEYFVPQTVAEDICETLEFLNF